MKWSHLPEPGGLYAQNPGMLDKFYYIMAVQSKWQKQEQDREAREAKNKAGRK